MTKWILAAILFGLFAITFAIGALSSASAVHDHGVQFLTSPTRRGGFTTADRTASMAFAAFISGLGCLGSVWAGARAHNRVEDVDEDDAGKELDSPAWTCPHCHEQNPGNFQECWKCQKFRSATKPELRGHL
jgi:hypothetical protein